LELYELGVLRDPEVNHDPLWIAAAFLNARAGQTERATDIAFRFLGEVGVPPWMGDFTVSEDELRLLFRGVSERRLELVPEKLRPMLFPNDWAAMGETDTYLTSRELLPAWIPDIWQPEFDSLRALPKFQEVLASADLAGVTVRRTPPSERVRPQFLRDSDAGLAAP
jgi:hypothetical protein